jgi:integrase/recombinase XerD
VPRQFWKRRGNNYILCHAEIRGTQFKEFISWKKKIGESVDPEAFLSASERSEKMALSAVQKRFKKWAKLAGLNPRSSIHSAWHTYGTMLYRLTKDLRLVQKQLGHSSSHITEVYADVLDEDVEKAVNLLYA